MVVGSYLLRLGEGDRLRARFEVRERSSSILSITFSSLCGTTFFSSSFIGALFGIESGEGAKEAEGLGASGLGGAALVAVGGFGRITLITLYKFPTN